MFLDNKEGFLEKFLKKSLNFNVCFLAADRGADKFTFRNILYGLVFV